MNDFSVESNNIDVSPIQDKGITLEDLESLYLDPIYTSTISRSDLEKIAEAIVAERPQIMIFTPGSLYDSLYSAAENQEELSRIGALIAERHNEIINEMLDKWNENIQKEAEVDREKARKDALLQGYIQWRENQSPSERIEKIDTESIETINHVRDAANYQSYLRSIPATQRYEELQAAGGKIVDNYLKEPSYDLQGSDLAKAALSALLVQALVITPMMQHVVISSIDQTSLSNQMAVKPIIEQNLFSQSPQLQQALMPAINFFALDLAKEVTVTLYLKQNEGAKENPLEFAKNYAKEALERTKSTEAVLAKLIETLPDASQIPINDMTLAAKLAQLFILVNALMLFVKAEGGANLQENELQQLLKGQGVPKGDVREQVIARMNAVLQSISEEQRVDMAELVLKYVGSRPDTDRLSDFFYALSSAMEEIGFAKRAVEHPID